jgi:peptide/nickel transport system substrate-binding protein
MSEIEKLKAQLASGKITRREFVRRVSASGLAASMPGLLYSGGAAAAPKKGGHFRVGKGHGNTSDTLDPATHDNGYMIALTQTYNGYMTEVGSDGSVQPGIAESWESSPDASEWTFKLRQGVTFHSGKPVTPDDVIASINHHRGEESTSAAKPIVADITDIRADGDSVVVKLGGGNADFPFTLSDYHIPVMPAKDGKPDWRSGDGCGTYRLTNFDAGVSAQLERYADHWAGDSRGFFESIDMLVLVDPNARNTALISGDVDAIDKVELKTVHLLKRKPDLAVHSVAGTQHYTFAMSCTKEPFTDANVRRALKHAINRQELVDKILQGYGVVGNDHPIGQGQRFYNDELPQTSYDPDKAKFYLKEAGLDSLSVDLSAADAAYPGAVDAAVLYQNSAKAGGVTVNVVREPNDGYWSDVWMKKAFAAVYWGGRPVEDAMFTTAYKTGASWNDTFWSNERFDTLLQQARAELDTDKRREMYFEMQKILNEDGGAIIPMFASYVFAASNKVGVPEQFATNYDMDGERWAERWWFA